VPEIILVGAGGHCKSVIDVIEQNNEYKIVGLIDKKENIGKKVLGYEILASDDDISNLLKINNNVMITIGHISDNSTRVNLYEKFKKEGFNFPSIISPLAYVSPHASIGEGNIIMHHASINAGATIKNNSIINSKALIEHDATIGNHVHISTGAIVNGGTVVKDHCFLGSQAVTKEYTEIEGFIKAGSVAK